MRLLAVVLASTIPTLAYAETRAVIHGDVDADRVREQLQIELATDITLAKSSCAAPCVSIRVENHTATVVYSPRSGGLRERTIELGDDSKQWPVTIALLAGNLARDEVSEVLADLPAPVDAQPEPAAPLAVEAPAVDAAIEIPIPPTQIVAIDERRELVTRVEPEREHEWTLFGFGFVPGLSTDFTHVGNVRHLLSLDLIAGVSGGSSLVTLSGVVDVERGDVHGAQIGGVVTVSRKTYGLQLSGVAAVTGELNGVQIAGTAAVSRGPGHGNQAAGVVTVADTSGVQFAGVAAYTRRDAGVQIGGVTATANAANVQIAGVTSVATNANLQIAGVVNVASRVRGLQLAPINVARKVDGIQIGVINVGGSADGFSFGLINIVPGGRYDLEGTLDSNSVGTLLFRHGGNGWHNVYGIGGHPVEESGPTDDVWMYGLGFGPSWRTHSSRIDLELVAWEVSHGVSHSDDLSILGQLRLSYAYGIGPIAIVAGAAYNAYISNDQMSPFIVERRTPGSTMPTTSEVTVERWPSGFLGIRL